MLKLFLFSIFLLSALSLTTCKLAFKEDGTFKILHLSDVHYRIGNDPEEPCRDVDKADIPYSQYGSKNTTDFIRRLIELEQPDLVVHTGDIIDGDTHTASQGMEDLYGVSSGEGVLWAATMGNHDDDSDLSRDQVMDYILSLPGGVSSRNALGPGEGEATESYGNFYLEIFRSTEDAQPSFRTFHLDANTNNVSINSQQVDWFRSTAAALKEQTTTPALAFFHIPLKEYYQVVMEQELCGEVREPISFNGQSGLFEALVEDGSVKATFVGHDHTNDFCGELQGIQLCYEGSPGFQGYGHCNVLGNDCVKRRARVTEIRDFGSTVNSWKRTEGTTYPETAVIDHEVLWAADGAKSGLKIGGGSCERKPSGISEAVYREMKSFRPSANVPGV